VNKCYKSVWSQAAGTWVAVSELTAARGRRASRLSAVAAAASLAMAGVAAQTVDYADGETRADPIVVMDPSAVLHNLGSGVATQSGAISGNGGITHTGDGTLVLGAANTYLGATTLNAGTLRVSSDTNLGGAGGDIVFAGAGTLQFGANGFSSARNILLGGAGGTIDVNNTVGGALTGLISGAGRLSLINSDPGSSFPDEHQRLDIDNAANSYAGGTTIAGNAGGAGRINVTTRTTGSLGTGPVELQDNAELRFYGPAASAGNLAIANQSSTDVLGTNTGVLFEDGADAGTATITTSAGAPGAYIWFTNANAANATIVNDGGRLYFDGTSSGGNANIDHNGGPMYIKDAADLSGATVRSNGGHLFINETQTGTSIGSLSGTGDVVLGDKTLTVGALGADDTFSGTISETGPAYQDANGGFYSQAVTAVGGSLVKTGTGTFTLSGTNTYTGATNVAQGTLRAGAAGTFSASSAYDVAAGATLDLAGFNQTIASMVNAGTVSLVGSAPGTTLTVTGPWVGSGGLLRLGTALGDSTSATDRLILDGPGATASGNTQVQIVNLGGLGALTTGHGIEVISAVNGATTTAQSTRDAFALQGGHVDAGAYEYRLYAADASGAGENWYLRSTMPVVEPPVDPGEPPVEPPLPPVVVPTYRAEVPLFAALPGQLRQGDLAMLGNLHQRIGDEEALRAGAAAPAGVSRRTWARFISTGLDLRQGGTVSPASRGRLNGLQAGIDVLAGDAWRAGLYAGHLEGDASVRGFASGVANLGVGGNDLRSRYLGLYGTYSGASGWYADAVLQFGRQQYRVLPHASVGASGKGRSTLASLEVGKGFAVGERWTVEPQLQLIHQRLSLGDVLISGARVQQDSASGWVARAGVRVKGEFATGLGSVQPYARMNAYRHSSGTDVARFIGPAGFADIATRTGGTSWELAGGATVALSQAVSVYGEIGRTWASGSTSRIANPVHGSVGLRVKW